MVPNGGHVGIGMGGLTGDDSVAEGEFGEVAKGVDVGGRVAEFGDFFVGGGYDVGWCLFEIFSPLHGRRTYIVMDPAPFRAPPRQKGGGGKVVFAYAKYANARRRITVLPSYSYYPHRRYLPT